MSKWCKKTKLKKIMSYKERLWIFTKRISFLKLKKDLGLKDGKYGFILEGNDEISGNFY